MSIIPVNAIRNKYSATVSNLCTKRSFLARIDKKEKKHEQMRNTAIKEVNSSIMLAVALFVRWKDVITTRQKPNRLVAAFKIF